MKIAGGHSHYDTLCVEAGASPESLKAAYRRLAQKFHPDKHQGRDAAAALMARINQAYEVLSDPQQRAAYDQSLAAAGAQSMAARRRSAAAIFIQDRLGWASWLLLVVLSIALLTVGYVVLKATVPAQPALRLPPPQVRPSTADLSTGFPAVPKIEPWTEPARVSLPPNDAIDPVRRLVREGALRNSAPQRAVATP